MVLTEGLRKIIEFEAFFVGPDRNMLIKTVKRVTNVGFLLLLASLITANAQPMEFIYHQRLIFLKADVNGQGELLFLFDTGASKSAIDLTTAEKIDLPISGTSKVEGSAGVIEVKNAQINTLTVGDAKAFDLEVTAYELSGLLAPPGMRVDGILGYDFLRYFSIEIDYARQTITFSKKSKPGSETQVRLPFTLDNNIPRLKGILDGKIEADFRLDTGASLFETTDIYLNTTESLWNELTKLNPKLKPEKFFSGSGVGGTVKLPVARIKNVSFGEIKSDNVFIIVQPKVGYFARSDAVGFVSNNLLEKYSPVTIDYIHKRIFLAKKGPSPFSVPF